MLAQGTVLRNHYRIIRHLGSGTFGDTYLAGDRDLPINSQCVVKHLNPTYTNPAVLAIARRLFEKEAQVLDELGSHNQIPRLLAHFEENGEFYLVQELVDGNDLTQEITPGKHFSEDEAIKLLHDILEVLEVVHQQKIIHRDIKPQNIMRRRIDGKIVLIDFGAVKEIGSLKVNTQGEVTSTVAIGTLGYMPSEQANGHPKLCSDIYAVGMIGIQALTGLSPQQLLRDTTGELRLRHYIPVSNDLMAVLTKMVRYHFSQRYQSATEALQAVNTLIPQQTSLLTRLRAQFTKPLVRGSLIGLGGLGAGILATFTFINRPQPLSPLTATSITPKSSFLQTDSGTQPDVNLTSQQFDDARSFSEGLASVKVGGKWGYINNQGKHIIQPLFDDAAENFSEGLASVKVGKKFVYINNKGKRVIQPQFDYAGNFSEKLAAVLIGGKWGYIDKQGNSAIQPKVDYAGNFSEKLAVVRIGKKYGYIDNRGNHVIQPQFDRAESFSEKLAVVLIGGKWGYIDNQGKPVIQPLFDDARDFSGGLAAVQIGEKWGYIDKQGKPVIQPQFEHVEDFSEGWAVIQEPDSKKYKYIPNPLK